MKTILLSLLTFWLAALVSAVGWFCITFTVFPAADGEGYLVLYDKEARECAVSTCAVYSETEIRRIVNAILHNMMQHQPQSLRGRT